jgi:hypothetical protein
MNLPLRDTHDLDLTGAMATHLRVARMSFDGTEEDLCRRAFQILWGPTTGGYTHAQIKPRLSEAIAIARREGPINLDAEPTAA